MANTVTYTSRELLDRLREFAAAHDEPVTRAAVRAADMPSPSTYRRRFGSWNTALREAGIDPVSSPIHGLSDQELLERLREFAAELDETPTTQDVNNADHLPSANTFVTRFGSWNAAVREIGLEPNTDPIRGLSDKELLDRFRDLADEVGEIPTKQAVNAADDLPSADTYRTRFGGWNSVAYAAGLLPSHSQ